MQYTYEFEVFESEGWLVAYPFDLGGATQGRDKAEVAMMAADLLRMKMEDCLMHNLPIPKATFGNEPQEGGYLMVVSAEASLDAIRKVTASEAARMLEVTPARVSHMIRDNLLSAFKDGDRTWVTLDSVHARLADRRGAGRPRKDAIAV